MQAQRTIIYARVSTAEQDSIENQISACREYVTRQDGFIAGIETDKLSGFDVRRPGYQNVLKAARVGEIDAVAVWKLDRLGRDHAEAIRAAQELDRLGIKILSVTEPVELPFFRDMMFLWAGEASRQTSQRVRLKMAADARDGKWNGRPPVGYLIGQDRRLRPDPRKAPLVTRLFELAATGRYSLRQLRDEAVHMGLTFSGNKRRPGEHPISRTRIGTILRNPAYVGDVLYGRVPNGRFVKRHHAPEAEWSVCRDAHPQLTDRDTFNAVAGVLKRNRAPAFQAGIRGSNFLLTGLLLCGDCGGRMYGGSGNHVNSAGKRYDFYWYSCVRGSEYGNCRSKSVGGKSLDEYIKSRLGGMVLAPEMLAGAEQILRNQADSRQDEANAQRRNLLKRREQIDAMRMERARNLLSSLIAPDIYKKLELQDTQSLAIIDAELRGLGERQSAESLNTELAILRGLAYNGPADSFDLEAWQDLTRLCIARVTVRRKPGERSTRWHMALDIDIEWTAIGEALRLASESIAHHLSSSTTQVSEST